MLLATLLSSCNHDRHEFTPNDQPVGYLTPLLTWEDPADVNSPTDDIRFIVSGTNGTAVTHNFTDAESAAQWLQQLPAGDYDLLVTVDMNETRGYLLTTVPDDSSSGPTTVPDTRTALPADASTETALPAPSSVPGVSPPGKKNPFYKQ